MTAKQTAMARFGFHEWPATHVRTPKAVDCRAYTCVLLEQEGYSRKQIADEVGFYDKSGVCHAIKVFKEKNMTVEKFEKRLRDLIGEVETSEINTPSDAIAYVLKNEAARIDEANTRFMHEMQKTY